MIFEVAIVGCGEIATHKYLPILQRLGPKVELVGICDLNEDILNQVATQFNVSNAYTDISDLLSEQQPDVVVVLTPPQTHAGLVVTALESGAHVLVEKPMAVNVADCDKMNDAATRYNRKLGIMHSQLFHPPLDQVRREVSEGRYGRFLGMRIFLVTGRDSWVSEPDHWAHKLRGGVVGETGPHAVYLSLAFLDHVREVQVRLAKHYPDCPWLIGDDIRFDLIADNGISSVALDYGSKQTTAELDIICVEQILRVDLQSRTVVRHSRLCTDLSAKGVGKSVLSAAYQRVSGLASNALHYCSSSGLDGHYVGIDRFLDYVAGDGDFPATGKDGRQTVAVLDQVVQQLEELRMAV
jgi:predicted dehydrogenase